MRYLQSTRRRTASRRALALALALGLAIALAIALALALRLAIALALALALVLCSFQHQQWANGNIICNELTKKEDRKKSQWWGDHFLAPLRDMLGEACREREMPDCEFFLNKRDYPQLKVNVPRGVPGSGPGRPGASARGRK